MILAIDAGTTGITSLIIDSDGRIRGRSYREFPQYFPRPGWVEHDAEEIWSAVREASAAAADDAGVELARIQGVGLTNQRETVVLWDRQSGQPVHRALVWQDRRTADLCSRFREEGHEDEIRARTGLLLDPYFSATKLLWILENEPGLKERAEAGELAAGTIDSWLVWKLSGGRLHITDPTNASRTLLYNLDDRGWDERLTGLFGIPPGILPEIRASSEVYGLTDADSFGAEIPIAGIAGDQQAALFGQGCCTPGLAKNTYGTGAFLLLYTGEQRVTSRNGLLTTVACGPRGEVAFALEGSIFIAGAAIQWLRSKLGILATAAESEQLAASIASTEGVTFVPAFTGLGAPYWEPDARGAFFGLTQGTGIAHLVRAALESIAFSTADIVQEMEEDSGVAIRELRVDGGAAENNWLMGFQADLLRVPVRRPAIVETTAFGAAGLAGLAIGLWESVDDFLAAREADSLFEPDPKSAYDELSRGWRRAVAATRFWARGAE